MRVIKGRNVGEMKLELAKRLDEAVRGILDEFGCSVPPQYKIRFSVKNANGRKIRSDSAANKWSPESDRIEIRFKPLGQDAEASGFADASSFQHAPKSSGQLHPAEVDLLRALDRAESRPGWSFVALKKFRDEILPQEHFPSMRSEVEQQNVLGSVIEKRFVLLGKVPNLKSPQFPVTTIRLNRLMPEVRAALGKNEAIDLDFNPVDIIGEPLSTTILRERR